MEKFKLKTIVNSCIICHELTNDPNPFYICDKCKAKLRKNGMTKEEPCDDCISRQAVLDATVKRNNIWKYITNSKGENLEEIILQLPPVIPQLKTGHWIDDKCSICGKGIENLIDSREWYRNEKPNFCPFCGIPLEWEIED